MSREPVTNGCRLKAAVVKIASKAPGDNDKMAKLRSAAEGLLGLRHGFARHPNKYTPSSGGVKLSAHEACVAQ